MFIFARSSTILQLGNMISITLCVIVICAALMAVVALSRNGQYGPARTVVRQSTKPKKEEKPSEEKES